MMAAVEKQLNLTPKRVLALRLLASRPKGVYVSLLAQEVLASEYRRRVGVGFAAQQATRAGAGYATPLINAGLVRKQSTAYGWGLVSITEKGLKALADIDATERSLDAVLERCLDAGDREGSAD